jgi:hypothetical protein
MPLTSTPKCPCEVHRDRRVHSAIETYYRVKRGVTQIVRVERVEVQPVAQAVIGVVARE